MTNILKKSQPSEFWLDCLNQSPISNPDIKVSQKNNFYNPLMNYIRLVKRNNKKTNTREVKSLYQNSKIILKALKSEEKPKKNKDKIKKSLNYVNELYKRGMEFKQKKNQLLNQNDKEDKEQLISGKNDSNLFDIYKPQYKNKKIQKKILKNFGNTTIYERGVKFQQKKMAKIAELFEENNKKNNITYSFHPDISFKNLNHVFFSDNFCKDQADNDSNKIFLSRLIKAREEEEFKKKFFENNINLKNIYKGYSKNRLKKSLSQKDSIIFKKKLHNSLLDLKCLESNESNNNTYESNNNDNAINYNDV